ncbi:hypothetical protein [Limosilactobacillus reuteri]|uniref:hypothetical protein n=1 Tax=Limosilactobacillus reuteri TaxID=1598 RepID=UPI000E3CC301|nr:hypothetical protein [Limosilactobacillus reuteri]
MKVRTNKEYVTMAEINARRNSSLDINASLTELNKTLGTINNTSVSCYQLSLDPLELAAYLRNNGFENASLTRPTTKAKLFADVFIRSFKKYVNQNHPNSTGIAFFLDENEPSVHVFFKTNKDEDYVILPHAHNAHNQQQNEQLTTNTNQQQQNEQLQQQLRQRQVQIAVNNINADEEKKKRREKLRQQRIRDRRRRQKQQDGPDF